MSNQYGEPYLPREEPADYRGPAGSRNDPEFEIVGICHRCKWQYSNGTSCKAFPEGIPAIIRAGDFIHTKPFPGDHGIRFKPRGGVK